MKRTRECGAGCGTALRRGHARLAHVVTVSGGLSRALVCPLCARRGVVMVAHLDEPLKQRPPLRTQPAKRTPWFEDADSFALAPTAPSVGTMSREDLEAEAMRRPTVPGQTGETIAFREGFVGALSRAALEAHVTVARARDASSSGTTAAPPKRGSVYEDREP